MGRKTPRKNKKRGADNSSAARSAVKAKPAPKETKARKPWPFDGVVSLVIAALFLYALFPPLNVDWLVWIAWVPLLYGVSKLSGRRLAVASFVVFYLLNVARVQWLHHVTWAGLFALAFYLTLYLWVFTLFARWCWRRGARLSLMGLLPAAWTLLELGQAHLLTGFGWFLTAYSQFTQPMLIQTADLGGPYVFGFAAMAVNVALYLVLMHGVAGGWTTVRTEADRPGKDDTPQAARGIGRPQAIAAAVLTVLIVGFLGGYGRYRLTQVQSRLTKGPVFALVQGNVHFGLDTLLNYDEERQKANFRGYLDLARQAARSDAVQVICLPESSVPVVEIEYGPDVPTLSHAERDAAEYRTALQRLARETGRHILFCGLRRVYTQEPGPETYYTSRNQYNAIYLMDPGGDIVGRYDKIHRVPFGEYIPLKDVFPWLHVFTPFTRATDGILPGAEQCMLTLELDESGGESTGNDGAQDIERPDRQGEAYEGALSLGPLVCFEDTHPYLSRGLQRMGSNMLVNLTNNAWFGRSEALTQELAAAVFRSVETRLPMVRCTNNGVSALIGPSGRYEPLTVGGEMRGVRGVLMGAPPMVEGEGIETPYVRWGEWGPLVLALAGALPGLPAILRGGRA